MSDVDQLAFEHTLKEVVGKAFRAQGMKLAGSFITLVVAATLAWANLQNRVSDFELYDTKAFRDYQRDHNASDEKAKILLYRVADKLGVRWDDLR